MLTGGPLYRNGKTAATITNQILNIRDRESGRGRFDTRWAWDILGYTRMARPPLARFVAEVNKLWELHAEVRMRRVWVARALILEAL